MCGRFDTSHLTWAQIHDALDTLIPAEKQETFAPQADVRPTTTQLTARLEEDGWKVEPMRWGLVPFWRGGKPLKDSAKGAGDGFKLTTFNCRVETCASASTFKGAYARRRCIVPASAWYEWTDEQGGKMKHRFSRADGKQLWFAGLWDRCKTSDLGEIASFTIMTGPSDGRLADFHSRAPVILEQEEWRDWLDPQNDASGLLRAVRPERFSVAVA